MSEDIKTYVILHCLSWAAVIPRLVKMMAASVHNLLRFTLGIISLPVLCFTLIHRNVSAGGSSAVSAADNSLLVKIVLVRLFLMTMTNWKCSVGKCLTAPAHWAHCE